MYSRILQAVFTAVVAVSFSFPPAFAQNVPRAVEQGHIDRQLERAPEPRAVPGGVELPTPLLEPSPESQSLRFELTDLVVEGSTVFSPAELIAPHRSKIGTEISLADLYAIANSMTVRYRNDGYILSQVYVPEQTIEQGRVVLKAVEGYVADVIFQGETKGRSRMLERMAREIRNSRPLTSDVLERYLLLMNDLPGALAQGTLRASQTVPGASTLIVNFYHDTANFSSYIDNHNSEYLGPVHVGVGLTLNSVLNAYESTSLNYIQATDRERLEFAAIAHSMQLTAGLKLTLSASTSDSVPDLDESFQSFNLETSSDNFSVRFDYPIRRSRASNFYWFSRLTYHDGETSSAFLTEQSADTISAMRMGLTYDSVDRWRGVNIFEVEVSKGLDAFGASKIDDENLSRPGGDPEFSKATLYAARLQSIGRGWSYLLAITGQYAFENVLGPEEFAFGGSLFGRAYDPSELVGDHGAAGKIELRYTHQGATGTGTTIYTFYDYGYLDQELGPNESDEFASVTASSAGLGVRFNIGRHVSGYIEGAKPLTRDVAAEGNDDPRYFGGLRLEF